ASPQTCPTTRCGTPRWPAAWRWERSPTMRWAVVRSRASSSASDVRVPRPCEPRWSSWRGPSRVSRGIEPRPLRCLSSEGTADRRRVTPGGPALSPTAESQIAERLESHRAALTGHCYRMLGSAAEADDAVQETMVRAWRNLDRFQERAALRTWLHTIATRVCLDALEDRTRRARPMELCPVGSVDQPLDTLPGERWIEPIADATVLSGQEDPLQRILLRQSIRLAFVAALQRLTPRQRAVLLHTEVLGWSAAETAQALEMTVPAVNSALQRARATLASHELEPVHRPLSDEDAALVDRYMEAFERYDMDALGALLHEEATMCMPPYRLWLQGPASILAWLVGPGAGCRGSRLVRTAASGAPAFGQYRHGGPGKPLRPWALVVLESDGRRLTGLNYFLDTDPLFPRFGLPPELPLTDR